MIKKLDKKYGQVTEFNLKNRQKLIVSDNSDGIMILVGCKKIILDYTLAQEIAQEVLNLTGKGKDK